MKLNLIRVLVIIIGVAIPFRSIEQTVELSHGMRVEAMNDGSSVIAELIRPGSDIDLEMLDYDSSERYFSQTYWRVWKNGAFALAAIPGALKTIMHYDKQSTDQKQLIQVHVIKEFLESKKLEFDYIWIDQPFDNTPATMLVSKDSVTWWYPEYSRSQSKVHIPFAWRQGFNYVQRNDTHNVYYGEWKTNYYVEHTKKTILPTSSSSYEFVLYDDHILINSNRAIIYDVVSYWDEATDEMINHLEAYEPISFCGVFSPSRGNWVYRTEHDDEYVESIFWYGDDLMSLTFEYNSLDESDYNDHWPKPRLGLKRAYWVLKRADGIENFEVVGFWNFDIPGLPDTSIEFAKQVVMDCFNYPNIQGQKIRPLTAEPSP